LFAVHAKGPSPGKDLIILPREPFVSVVVTTFNQAPYIGAALQSVFNQSYGRYEVIVVDDGSTDDTPRVLQPLQSRILHVRQANQGVAAARNTGVRQAKGELVAFLDGDDLWEPDKLASQVEAALANPGSGLIATDGLQFDDAQVLDESLIGPSVRPLLNLTGGVATIEAFRHLLIGNFIATVSQVMIPRAVLESIGPSDPSLALVSDWDLYLRISRRYPISLISRKLVRWRYLATSASGPEALRRLRWGIEGVNLLDKHFRLSSPELRPLLRRWRRLHAFTTAQTAYFYGLEEDRHVAIEVLCRLLLKPYSAAPSASYLLALYTPRIITARLGPVVRALLNPHLRTHE
jgi:glycosyltransferase involved in cell wall biosynthesis